MYKLITRNFLIFAIIGVFFFLTACSSDSSSGDSSTSDKGSKSAYPNGTIELIVPASAGGDTDRNARLLAQHLEGELGVSVIVQNINGASGTVGVQEILDADPDGNKVLFFHNTMLMNNILGLTENTYSDIKIGGISGIDYANGVVVAADSPYKSIQDLVDAAKEKPKSLNLGTAVGAFTHFQMLDVMDKTGVEFNLVDSGDFAERIAALLGGQLAVVPMQLGLVTDYLENGDMRALGVFSEDRLEQFPDVPTFKESGIDSVFEKFFFVAFQKDTSDEIVDTFTKAVEKVTQKEEYIEKAKELGFEAKYMNPEEATQLIKERDEYYREIYEKQ